MTTSHFPFSRAIWKKGFFLLDQSEPFLAVNGYAGLAYGLMFVDILNMLHILTGNIIYEEYIV